MGTNETAPALSLFLLLADWLLDAFALLWSLNTLFHLGIAYEVETVFAALLLCLLLRSSVGKRGN